MRWRFDRHIELTKGTIAQTKKVKSLNDTLVKLKAKLRAKRKEELK